MNQVAAAGIDPAAVNGEELARLIEARDSIPRKVFLDAVAASADPGFRADDSLGETTVSDAATLDPSSTRSSPPTRVRSTPTAEEGGPPGLLRRPGMKETVGKADARGQRAPAGEAQGVSAETVRRLWERIEARDRDGVADQLHPDVVVDWPNTAERMRGRANFLAVQQAFGEGWHVQVLRIVDGGDTVVPRPGSSERTTGSSQPRSSRGRRREDRVRGRVLVGRRSLSPRPSGALPRTEPLWSGLEIRQAEPSDHARVIAVLDDWWGGRHMVDMLPKLFRPLPETSFVAERDGELAGFLWSGLVADAARGGVRPLRRRQPGEGAAAASAASCTSAFRRRAARGDAG